MYFLSLTGNGGEYFMNKKKAPKGAGQDAAA
jgi:hypothetical protein